MNIIQAQSSEHEFVKNATTLRQNSYIANNACNSLKKTYIIDGIFLEG